MMAGGFGGRLDGPRRVFSPALCVWRLVLCGVISLSLASIMIYLEQLCFSREKHEARQTEQEPPNYRHYVQRKCFGVNVSVFSLT